MSNKRIKIGAIFLTLVILLVMPLFLDLYLVHILNQIGIMVILTASLNLMVGYTGQLSFAHIGLFAVGAYTSAILTTTAGFSFWTAFPIAAIIAGIFGFIIGLPVLRFKTHFFAIVTMAFGEIIRLTIYNLRDLTGGPNGIYNIPFPTNFFGLDFALREHFYYLILVSAIIVILLVKFLINTRTGRAMIAIRENENFALFVGINTWRVKIFAFTISAAIAGFAGSLYAHYNSYISPYSFTISESVSVLLMVIIGGMGTIIGPILGTTFLTFLPELLRSVSEYRMVIYGGLLVLTIMFMRDGILGVIKSIKFKKDGDKRVKIEKPLPSGREETTIAGSERN
ncbi:branched-chain amino acid ABC transporter permease [Neobacillus sp. FSL H8-0543]|uniref:branched-chain amino acid ABC transporter permease n=1 Tax=Neobacillus sp. FSL H8-0543 TaxID=2954672 RepID=UPI003158C968